MEQSAFDAEACLHKLMHYLPAQAPLKDFVHHNTLHSFQEYSFFEALKKSSSIFGYRTSLSLQEYRARYAKGEISDAIIKQAISQLKGVEAQSEWKHLMLTFPPITVRQKRIGKLRQVWKQNMHLDLDTLVHLNLFKIVGAYLDQGISLKQFPLLGKGLLDGLEEIENNSFFELFHSKRVRKLLFNKKKSLNELLTILVGDERYFEQYLFDQQFAHPGWSGMVAVIEKRPHTLLDKRNITLFDFIYLELLLEIDALDKKMPNGWLTVAQITKEKPLALFADVPSSEYWEVVRLWQTALELSYYDQVLAGVQSAVGQITEKGAPSFQAFFCIDDREESIRRHIELLAPSCETLGTPAHFNLKIMYQPENGKYYTQVCPGAFSPEHLIKEVSRQTVQETDIHFQKDSHHLFKGLLISQTLGFWSGLKLFWNIFKPGASPAHSSAFEHMDHESSLIIDNENGKTEKGYQLGFTLPEMVQIVKGQLSSTGLTKNFAPLVYMFGHGGSSTNNPYYAGYNCGACSGRPSSVNARVFANMANRKEVRELLQAEGIQIPEKTQFLGGLHDTTRDEFVFYDAHILSPENEERHKGNLQIFEVALQNNAKERSRQFDSINTSMSAKEVHEDVKLRSVALFEPRPELNHSNNTLCIVGSRKLTDNIFLDQRAFLNSYDYRQDTSGEVLGNILNAATPVCGGINLEYYFSRVDNENFGAGSKLPHNVVGLFGLSNGIEGDLRTGLPIQMVEVHEPTRLLMVVQQFPEVVLETIKMNPNTYQWYENEWVKLAVVHPETSEIFLFDKGGLVPYQPLTTQMETVENLMPLFETSRQNLPVCKLH